MIERWQRSPKERKHEVAVPWKLHASRKRWPGSSFEPVASNLVARLAELLNAIMQGVQADHPNWHVEHRKAALI
ncbi:MAG TPA: hypothetical protein VJR89_40125 [Polyangiales bacterium]|nr:hypothetical protein [Polyangiales bacterium]